MSKFAEEKKNWEKIEERLWERRKLRQKYWNDISKITFAGLVISQLSNIQESKLNLFIFTVGIILTYIFKYIGDKQV